MRFVCPNKNDFYLQTKHFTIWVFRKWLSFIRNFISDHCKLNYVCMVSLPQRVSIGIDMFCSEWIIHIILYRYGLRWLHVTLFTICVWYLNSWTRLLLRENFDIVFGVKKGRRIVIFFNLFHIFYNILFWQIVLRKELVDKNIVMFNMLATILWNIYTYIFHQV